MHEVVINEGLDLLHVHYAIPHATSAWIAKEMLRKDGRDITVITTLHGTDITIVGQDHSFHAITKFSIEKSDRITAVSQFLKEETIRAFGCTECDVSVIPNFVDPAVYDRSAHEPTLRRQMGEDKKILMHISNFRPVKRVLDVVRIFARVRKEVPSVLVMVGDGPDRLSAEQEARALGVERDVHFLGRIDPVAPLLACADLYLLPTDRESFGLSALEALACGVPALAYDVGGIREVVKNGVTGALRPVGDVDGLAEFGVALLRDPPRWSAMSAAAAADARDRFSSDQIVARYEALYLRALS
jgi:N-acetyl-alpha-D-glucosaminyl L-malate synthase BshA